MRPEDWFDVAEIYAAGIAGGDATFEIAVPEQEIWHARHLADHRLVAEAGGEVVGWAALSRVSDRSAYAGVAEVSVYVAPGATGHGVGRGLLVALVARSEAAGLWTLQASIFPENVASLALHARCGFRVVGRRERIGRHTLPTEARWRDTILLERRSRVTGT